MPYDRASRCGDVLRNPTGRAILGRYFPGIVNSPLEYQLREAPVGRLVALAPALRDDAETLGRLWAELAAVTDDRAAPSSRPEEVPPEPSPDYEPRDVAEGSAPVRYERAARRWGVAEVELRGPAHGNPFTDVALTATFRQGDRMVTVPGFYDGAGVYRVRFMPGTEGAWTFTTHSNARSLHAVTGRFDVGPAQPGDHGPVGVRDTFHFAHADGSRYLPVGTTAYAWTHQDDGLQEQTLATLGGSPFNKVRMCVFPKAYLFNTNEPRRYPFERSADGGWDFTRFDPAFFGHLERRVADLAAIGVEADVILFHPYDRWGFADMGAAADDRYVRYVAARLAAHRNVWWSLANEYDLMRGKTAADWERFAGLVTAADPYGHLLSIHNCHGFYDHTRPWVTHASVQRVDVYRTAENTGDWRRRWGKPVVIDECGYEGDIDQGWGNLTPEELVRRFWEAAVRGGYTGHGETYLDPGEVLWWSKGGVLRGQSPARIAFLRRIVEASPGGALDPLPSDWDVPTAGVPGAYFLTYFSFMRPRYRTFLREPGVRYRVDVIDTWNMTVEELLGTFEGAFRVDLPGRPYMAVRMRAV